MNSRIRFEDEADAEYRAAGRWYEERRAGLGLEFFDEVDAAIGQVLEFPRAGERARRLPAELPVRRVAVKRFPYHVEDAPQVTSTLRQPNAPNEPRAAPA